MLGLTSARVSPVHTRHPAISAAFRDCRRVFRSVALFSAAVNLLMLAGPLYMLQVYDRVLTSHSIPTLIALSLLLAGALALQALLDVIRGRLVTRAAGFLDQHLADPVHRAVLRLSTTCRPSNRVPDPVRDLDQIRSFLTGQGPIAAVDLPWIPIFLIICAMVHPWLGLLALTGAVMLAGTTLLTECASRAPAREATRAARERALAVEADRRSAETTAAMRMEPTMSKRWLSLNAGYVTAIERSSDVINLYSSLSKVTRMILQSAALGLGAYLVVQQLLMPGAMIAASVLMARALAPIETAIANWRTFVQARDSLRRLTQVLARADVEPARTALPKPCRSLEAAGVTVAPPESTAAILTNIHFDLVAGEAMAIIGPSGSGKTSLVRMLAGIWPPARGAVRIDGATLEQWPPEMLGPELGYVSQSIDLFDGTVAENIARMAGERDSGAVVAAARAAGAHEMILRLPDGYDTPIGPGGAVLSAGQRQRVALARALYGDPFLIVLDEPNANLDAEGEAALLQALGDAKARAAIVILITHRPGLLSVCDKVLVLGNGGQQAFGSCRDIMGQAVAPPVAVAANARLKIVKAEAMEAAQ